MNRLATVPLAAAVLNPVVDAQLRELPVDEIRYIHYDYATKKVTHLDGPLASAGEAPGTSFANTALTLIGIPTPIGDEIVDWGVKAGGLTSVVSGGELGYVTTALDPSVFGPGADVEVALFSGTLGSCTPGDPGVELVRLTFTGLPGSLTGAPIGYIMFVDVGSTAFVLPDGPIGWSYVGLDGVTGPLTIVVGAQPTGTVDLLDVYTPAPATTGVCSGPSMVTGPGTNSLYVRLEEEDGTEPPEETIDNGSDVNPMLFGPGSTPPAIGSVWDPTFAPGLPGTTMLEIIGLSLAPLPPGVILPFGELLIDIAPPNFFLTVVKPPGGPFAIPIPLNTNLIDVEIFTQAVRVFTNPGPPGPPLISAGNRTDITIGL